MVDTLGQLRLVRKLKELCRIIICDLYKLIAKLQHHGMFLLGLKLNHV